MSRRSSSFIAAQLLETTQNASSSSPPAAAAGTARLSNRFGVLIRSVIGNDVYLDSRFKHDNSLALLTWLVLIVTAVVVYTTQFTNLIETTDLVYTRTWQNLSTCVVTVSGARAIVASYGLVGNIVFKLPIAYANDRSVSPPPSMANNFTLRQISARHYALLYNNTSPVVISVVPGITCALKPLLIECTGEVSRDVQTRWLANVLLDSLETPDLEKQAMEFYAESDEKALAPYRQQDCCSIMVRSDGSSHVYEELFVRVNAHDVFEYSTGWLEAIMDAHTTKLRSPDTNERQPLLCAQQKIIDAGSGWHGVISITLAVYGIFTILLKIGVSHSIRAIGVIEEGVFEEDEEDNHHHHHHHHHHDDVPMQVQAPKSRAMSRIDRHNSNDTSNMYYQQL